MKKSKNKKITKIQVKGAVKRKGNGDPEIYKKGLKTQITKENAKEYNLRSQMAIKEGKFFKACILKNLNKPLTVELEDGQKIKGRGIDVITQVAFIQSGNGDPHARKWVSEYIDGKPEQPIKGDIEVKDTTLTNLSDEALAKIIEKL